MPSNAIMCILDQWKPSETVPRDTGCWVFHLNRYCSSFILVRKKIAAQTETDLKFDIIHSMHYAYNQSHSPTDAHSRVTD